MDIIIEIDILMAMLKVMAKVTILTLTMLNLDSSCFENNVAPEQLAS